MKKHRINMQNLENQTSKDKGAFGCYFLHIYYPSNIALEPLTGYLFELEGIEYSIRLIKNLQSLMTNDFDNRFIKKYVDSIPFHELEKDKIKIEADAFIMLLDNGNIAYAINTQKNLYTEFYTKDYTEVIIFFESCMQAENVELARKALDYFVDSYRFISGDVLTLNLSKTTYVSTVVHDYFHAYTEDEAKLSKEERSRLARAVKLNLRQVTFPFWNTQGKHIIVNKEAIGQNLQQYFNSKTKPDLIPEFLLKAREELYVHKNYKYSFIETWTTLEIAIATFLKKIKLEKGISKTKVDEFESEVGISYLLNIELPLIHQTNDEQFKLLVNRVDGVRKLRNKVIHKNKNISLEEAENAYTTALEFLKYLGVIQLNNGKYVSQYFSNSLT